MKVILKSIRNLQSYRSLNIQNIARDNFNQQSFNVLQEKLNSANVRNNKANFPLGGIFRAERHFLLFKDQLADDGRQKTKENIIPRLKIPPSGKRLLCMQLLGFKKLRVPLKPFLHT